MALEITPATKAIGATVSGVDLRQPLDDSTFKELQTALLDHLVLFFRDQPLSPEEQRTLALRFGSIDIHPFGKHLSTHPDVGILDQTAPKRDGANRWHMDSTFMPTPPSIMTLRAVQLPSGGGDTTWASMYAAFETLSAPIRQALEKMTATHDVTGPLVRAIQGGHSIGGLEEIQAAWPLHHHPVVVRHPETNRKVLYVNSNFTARIDGVSDAESDALLRFLFEWVQSPEFQVRFRWEPDSLALWDNRCTQHFAVADYSERRVMHRVQVASDWIPAA